MQLTAIVLVLVKIVDRFKIIRVFWTEVCFTSYYTKYRRRRSHYIHLPAPLPIYQTRNELL